MEPMITSFGISLAAGIVVEVFKSTFPLNINKQIEDAFDEAINKCVRNDDITKRSYKSELKKIIRENYAKNPNANLKDESITGLHAKFFIEFELALIKKDKAYSYIKEIRDSSRFQELKDGQENLKQGIDDIKEQLSNLISQSNLTSSLRTEYLRQLSQYQKNLENLNPSIALENILALEESFEKNNFEPDDILKSNIELLKAKCYGLIKGKEDATFTCYINAYNLNHDSNEAKELAAYAYFKKGNIQKAEDLAENILLIDEYNPIAWALKSVLTDLDSLSKILEDIPESVIKSTSFKRFLFFLSIANNKFKDLDDAFEKYNILLDISYFDNTNLTYQNYRERLFLVESIIQRFSKNLYINFIKDKTNKEDIEPFQNILTNFLNGIKKSELDNFKIVKFFHAYFNYLINGNKDSVYLMKDIYKDFDDKSEFHLVLVANSLQKEGDVDGAINLIRENGLKSETVLYLEMFCLQQKSKYNEYVEVTKQYLSTIKQISIFDSERLLGIIDYLNSIDKLNEFEIDEFIQNKEFETEYLKTLFQEYITVINNKNTENSLATLVGIKDEILEQNETNIKIRLAKLFYFLKAFEESFVILNDIVNKTVESEELYYLILSLYHGKLNQTLLKQLIFHWRKNFSPSVDLLKIEIDLSFKLYDYDTIVEICKRYILEKQDDEFILTNYAIALYNSENEYEKEFNEYSQLIKDFDFQQPSSANSVAEILNRKSYYMEAFSIYYNAALKFPESKSAYFIINIPKELDVEYDVVKEGLFIQFETNGKLNIVEVTNKLPFAKKIIGQTVNHRIEINKKIGNLKQYITIKKILNKYQALKIQIMDEITENNPLSEIPAQSFNFKEHIDSGGNILDFIKDIVGENNFEENKKQDIEKYYKGEVSFTEIVMSYYSYNFIRAYYEIKYEKGGILQIPPRAYPFFDFNYYDYFILDFTSLLSFFELSVIHKIRHLRKFILPTSTKTIIKLYQSEGIVYQGKNYVLNEEFYNCLLIWIKDNCEFKMSDSKLDIVSKMPNREKQNIVYDYFLDIASLMLEFNKSLLITDDFVYTKMFPLNSRRIIGSSTYIIMQTNGQ